MEHSFTPKIQEILGQEFGKQGDKIFASSNLLQYLNIKTRSADRSSKSRSSYGNLYALYVLIEDYLQHGYPQSGDYSQYADAVFSKLFRRQRELPFGSKLQNHGLNHRMNEEFRRYFPQAEYIPILRNVSTNRYWINENLLRVAVDGKVENLAQAVIKIIDAYIDAKKSSFEKFIEACEQMQRVQGRDQREIEAFILSLLEPRIDARIFEIVSYAILKYHYHDQMVYFGFELDALTQENLKLYKTGRTNANDGGIDFVMRPLGRFFQVTETLDVKKYFLDIDKIEKFPVTFVIKSTESLEMLRTRLEDGANKQYGIKAIVQDYMAAIEEIINIPRLAGLLKGLLEQGRVSEVLNEIIKQSKVEFNYEEEEEGEEIEDTLQEKLIQLTLDESNQ